MHIYKYVQLHIIIITIIISFIRVFILIFLRQTMSLGNTLLLFKNTHVLALKKTKCEHKKLNKILFLIFIYLFILHIYYLY